ncbi:MAG TPA: hypothetical protein VFH77_05190 [Streptomyces sp.]|nr:hypothetical protein [Streptomyces sp.]
MRTRLVNTAADVIHRALQRCETSAGIAIALDSAGLLMSPETAAELAVLREDIATADQDVVEAQRHNDATCEAAQALDRVRAVHERIGGPGDDAFCYVCSNHGDIDWPCATVAAIAPPADRCALHGPSCDGDMEQAHIMQPAQSPLLDPKSFDRPGQRAAARTLNAEAGER